MRIAWYVGLGAFHEASHLLATWLWKVPLAESGWVLCLRTLLGRQVILLQASEHVQTVEWIRHVGWLASLVLAVALHYSSKRQSSELRFVAWIVAFEAIWSDLLVVDRTSPVCGCGNFGILLLHPSASDMALQVLEQMMEITSIRGAQSGGVVTLPELRRTRVVNRKRTNLARLLRRRLTVRPQTTALVGHTRFATTSKATLEGTHPHQWTPPTRWSVLRGNAFERVPVHQFITHNGGEFRGCSLLWWGLTLSFRF